MINPIKHAARTPSKEATPDRLIDILVFCAGYQALFAAEAMVKDFPEQNAGFDVGALAAHLNAGQKTYKRYHDALRAGVEAYLVTLPEGITQIGTETNAVARALRVEDRDDPQHIAPATWAVLTRLSLHPAKMREVFPGRAPKAVNALVKAVTALEEVEVGNAADLAVVLKALAKIPSLSAANILREWTKAALKLVDKDGADGSDNLEILVGDAQSVSNVAQLIKGVGTQLDTADEMTAAAADLHLEKIGLENELAEAILSSEQPGLVMSTAVAALQADTLPAYLRHSNDQQIAYVLSKGRVLLNAGAGSGKSTTLVNKIKYLVDVHGLNPDTIMATSFTRAAALELEEKLKALYGIKGEYLGSTSNSIGCKILRKYGSQHDRQALINGMPQSSGNTTKNYASTASSYAEKQLAFAPYTSDWTPPQAHSPMSTQAIALREPKLSWIHYNSTPRGEDGKPFNMKQLWLQISKWRYALVSPEEAAAKYKDQPNTSFLRAAAALYNGYDWLKKNDPVMSPLYDFDDQIIEAYRLLVNHPQALKELQSSIQAVFVDEGQDYNEIQMRLFALISGKALFVDYIGDDRQSIYAFRGASPEQFMQLKDEDFTVLNMETNYRSGSAIVEAGEQLIKHNTNQLPKVCRADITRGRGEITYSVPRTHGDAALEIASEIEAGITNENKSPDDFGVVVRNNAEKDAVMLALISKGIPYRSNSGTDFLNKGPVQFFIAALRVATLTHSAEVPERSRAMLDMLQAFKVHVKPPSKYPTQAKGASDVVAYLLKDKNTRDPSLAVWQNYVAQITRAASTKNMGTIMDAIFNTPLAFKEGKAWSSKSLREQLGSLIDMEELQENSASGDLPSQADLEEMGMAVFQPLKDLAEAQSSPREYVQFLTKLIRANIKLKKGKKSDKKDATANEPAVQIDTCHQWKGLEAQHVFVVMSGAVWPHPRSFDTPQGLAEERRLAYVAITRGRDSVKVLSPLESYNGFVSGVSQFVSEACIPPDDGRHADAQRTASAQGEGVNPYVQIVEDIDNSVPFEAVED
jgi:superfamily I DNA/RNA helicase